MSELIYDPDVIIPRLEALKPGERLVYFRGFFGLVIDNLDKRPDGNGLMKIFKAALELYEVDRVHLMQRKLGPFDFEYIAVGSRKAKKKENGK